MQEDIRRQAQRQISEFPGTGVYEWHVAADSLVWSPGLVQIYGLDRAPTVEEGFTHLVHPDDRTRVEAETSSFLGEGQAYAHTFRIVRPDGEVRRILDRGVIERNNDGTPRVLRGINVDITDEFSLILSDQQATISALRENVRVLHDHEQRLELAYAASGIAFWDVDLISKSAVWSPQLYDLLGVSPDSASTSDLFMAHIHPDDAEWLRARYETAIAEQSVFDEEFRVVRANDGATRTVVGKGKIFAEADGQPSRMVGVNYDITERKQRKEQLNLLMHEVNHRAKNLLSLVQAIARQSAEARHDDFLEKLNARIQALSASQDILVNDDWSRAEMHNVVGSQLLHCGDMVGKRIIIEGERLVISAAAAQAIGMAIHELCTNASKYGALSNDQERIDLTWKVAAGDFGGATFNMTWLERGGPPVRAPKTFGFGSTVLDRMMRAALPGNVETTYAPEGVTWTLNCAESHLYENAHTR